MCHPVPLALEMEEATGDAPDRAAAVGVEQHGHALQVVGGRSCCNGGAIQGDSGRLVLEEFISPQPKVIRAILLDRGRAIRGD